MLRFGALVSVMAVYAYGAAVDQSNLRDESRYLQFINQDLDNGLTIEDFKMWHKLDNGNLSPITTSYQNILIDRDGTSGSYSFQLPEETSTDYWFLQVRKGSEVLQTRPDIYCNLVNKDYGIVKLYITVSGRRLVIRPPSSQSSCDYTLEPVTSAHLQSQVSDAPELMHASFSLKYAKFVIENKFGSQIVVEKLTHYLGNNAHDPSNTVVENLTLEGNEASKPYDFAFANGFLPPKDYWFVQIRVGNDVLKTKTNFYCNMTSSDTGITKLIIDVLNKKFRVIPPTSSSCQVALLSQRDA